MKPLPNLIEEHACHLGEKIALRFLADLHEESRTYTQLYRRVTSIAAWLRSEKLMGQPVLLAYPAGLDFVEAFLGCITAGAIAIPVPMPITRHEQQRLGKVAQDAQAVCLLSSTASQASLRELTGGISIQFTDTLPSLESHPFESPGVDSPAFVQYTSGSTSDPRGVVVSHANIMANLKQIAKAFRVAPEASCVTWLPHYHDMGLIGSLLAPISQGCQTVILSPRSFLKRPAAWLKTISATEIAISGGPTFAYQHCVDRISAAELQSLDLKNWQVAFVGAEPVRSEVLERFAEKFAVCGFSPEAFLPCYGMAEATLMVSGELRSEPPSIKLHPADGRRQLVVSCGPPVDQTRVEIRNSDTEELLPDGQEGEVWITGPQVSHGYWQPDSSCKLSNTTTPSSTLRTGDLGLLWEGDLYITGRKKDLIIIRGENYHPHDLESVVCDACPSVNFAVAASTLSKGTAEQLIVVAEVRRRELGDSSALLATIRESVWQEYGLTPSQIYLVPSGAIPRTSSGKLRRKTCLKQVLNRQVEILAEWKQERASSSKQSQAEINPSVHRQSEQEIEQWLVGYLATQLGIEADKVDPETPFAEWGVDSTIAVETVSELEQAFSTSLEPKLFWEYPTIRQLAEHLGTCQISRSNHHRSCQINSVPIKPETRIEDFEEVQQFQQRIAKQEHNPYFQIHEGIPKDKIKLAESEVLSFTSYNYLGLNGHTQVIDAAAEAIHSQGTSVSASRIVSGERHVHQALEQEIATFLGCEAAIAMVSGHPTNVTVLGHMFGPEDTIVYDSLSHNSIQQGIRLSGAKARAFAHNNIDSLARILAEVRPTSRRVLIVVEGIYSMDGDIAPLDRIVELKYQHQALLYVDEAHSIGVLGNTGRGIGEHFNIARSNVDFWMGTLSKAFASCGGYIAGDKSLIEYLKYNAPGFVFSVGLPPANAAAALKAIQILRRNPHLAVELQQKCAYFLGLLQRNGMNTGTCQGTPVVPCILGNSEMCVALYEALLHRGVHVLPIVYPGVSEQQARLRFFVTVQHTKEQLRYTADVLRDELSSLRNPQRLVSS